MTNFSFFKITKSFVLFMRESCLLTAVPRPFLTMWSIKFCTSVDTSACFQHSLSRAKLILSFFSLWNLWRNLFAWFWSHERNDAVFLFAIWSNSSMNSSTMFDSETKSFVLNFSSSFAFLVCHKNENKLIFFLFMIFYYFKLSIEQIYESFLSVVGWARKKATKTWD